MWKNIIFQHFSIFLLNLDIFRLQIFKNSSNKLLIDHSNSVTEPISKFWSILVCLTFSKVRFLMVLRPIHICKKVEKIAKISNIINFILSRKIHLFLKIALNRVLILPDCSRGLQLLISSGIIDLQTNRVCKLMSCCVVLLNK